MQTRRHHFRHRTLTTRRNVLSAKALRQPRSTLEMWCSERSCDPDRGFGKKQPGGWIYSILPFIEQQAFYDQGANGNGMAIEDANAKRVATALSGLNCPSRRAAAPYRLSPSITFTLTAGPVTHVARSDYAINSGDYLDYQYDANSPKNLTEADGRAEAAWDELQPDRFDRPCLRLKTGWPWTSKSHG